MGSEYDKLPELTKESCQMHRENGFKKQNRKTETKNLNAPADEEPELVNIIVE